MGAQAATGEEVDIGLNGFSSSNVRGDFFCCAAAVEGASIQPCKIDSKIVLFATAARRRRRRSKFFPTRSFVVTQPEN